MRRWIVPLVPLLLAAACGGGSSAATPTPSPGQVTHDAAALQQAADRIRQALPAGSQVLQSAAINPQQLYAQAPDAAQTAQRILAAGWVAAVRLRAGLAALDQVTIDLVSFTSTTGARRGFELTRQRATETRAVGATIGTAAQQQRSISLTSMRVVAATPPAGLGDEAAASDFGAQVVDARSGLKVPVEAYTLVSRVGRTLAIVSYVGISHPADRATAAQIARAAVEALRAGSFALVFPAHSSQGVAAT